MVVFPSPITAVLYQPWIYVQRVQKDQPRIHSPRYTQHRDREMAGADISSRGSGGDNRSRSTLRVQQPPDPSTLEPSDKVGNTSLHVICALNTSLADVKSETSHGHAIKVPVPPSLCLTTKRAATSNIRHFFVFKKPRVSQEFGQATKSIIRRRIISANSSGPGKARVRSDSYGNLDASQGMLLPEANIKSEKRESITAPVPEVKETDLYTEEDLEKVNLELETVQKSINELKAKKKEQFTELKALLAAEKQQQKRAAEEASARQKQLALEAASAASNFQYANPGADGTVGFAPMRAMMASKTKQQH